MSHLKSKIAAATALALIMSDVAPLAYAAGAPRDRTPIDDIVTGPVPETLVPETLVPGTFQLAQILAPAEESGEAAPAEEEQPRRQRRKQQGEAAQEGEAEQAPRNDRRARQPDEALQAPAAEAPAEQPAEAPAEQPAEAAEEPAQPTNRRAQQPEEAPAAGEGEEVTREERLRQRREALRQQQQEQQSGDAVEQPAEPLQRAEPAEPQQPQPAQPAQPPQQAEPAQPAQPAQPPQQAQPIEPVAPPAAGQDDAQQAQPAESATERQQRLRERRDALRRLQQGEGNGDAAGEDATGGGVLGQPGAPAEQAQPPRQEGTPDVVEGAPENAAPILDSQKPRRRPGDRGNEGRDNGGRDIGEGNGTVAPPIAAAPTPPPQSDADAQADRPRASDIPSVRDERGRRVDERPRRFERREGADVLEEIGSRVIFELGNQLLIENNDRSRITRNARDVYYEELPRGRVRETIVRPNGVTVVTVRDRYGDIIRRSRIAPDGRESVLVYVDEQQRERRRRGEWRDPGEDLPPLVIDMPYEDYIFDAERVDYDDADAYYEFLEQPPVEKVERLYSVDEVKRSARVRDSVRRVDLDTITFDTGSAIIGDSQVEKLDGVANAMLRLLERNPAETFLIEGHTDAVGSDLSNLALSDERAESVASALTQVFGIPPENLTTQGYGEQYLKIDTEAGERENRRVAMRRITALVAPVASAQ